MKLNQIIKYVPNFHGEHGVDSFIHNLLKETHFSREVFSNLPGGSWTEFNICDYKTGISYKWDHIPRVTTSKRPDAVFQEVSPDNMSFLLVESKRQISELEEKIGSRLREYLDFNTGLFSKPCWQIRSENVWEIIKVNDLRREWIKEFGSTKVNLYTCYAYGTNPEVIQYENRPIITEIEKQKKILQENPDIDLVIAVSWDSASRYPYIIFSNQEQFSNNSFGKSIIDKLNQYNYSQFNSKDS